MIDELLLTIKMHPDRAHVFGLFDRSGVPEATIKTPERFGIARDDRICDVG